MLHSHSLLYFQLLVNALMFVSLGMILPYTIIITAKTLRYMANTTARRFIRFAVLWFITLSSPFVFEFINGLFGPWDYYVIKTCLGMSIAPFTISFALYCYLNRHALQTLLPKEDFLVEQEKRQRLLAKLEACDNKMPMARFEARNGVVLSANPWAQQLLGFSLLELHRMEPGAIVHPEDRARALQNMLIQDGKPYECRVITATGRTIFVEVRSTQDPSDESLHIVFLTDITNYVEERDKRLRDYVTERGSKNRRAAESNLMQEVVGIGVM